MSEYNIKALVKWQAVRPEKWNPEGKMDRHMGTVVMCRTESDGDFQGPKGEWKGNGWSWPPSDVIINPTEQQIKEEANKAGIKMEPIKTPKKSPLTQRIESREAELADLKELAKLEQEIASEAKATQEKRLKAKLLRIKWKVK